MNKIEDEFVGIIRQNKSTIYKVCYMFSNNEEEVADFFQEALIRLWQGFKEFQGQSNVKTWIYRVTLNSCINIDKKKRRQKAIPLEMDINLFEDNDGKSLQIEMLHRRISKLEPFDRAIIMLWLENISYEEIGLIVGISTKNVSVRLYRIREQLKQMSNS